MKTTSSLRDFALAICVERHPEVRRVLDLNAWKIKSWSDYAAWKKHGRKFVAIEWRNKCRILAAANGFVETTEVAA